MIIETVIAILLGVTSGCFTGITPGIHINLISAIVLSISPLLSGHISLTTIGVFIIAMSVTHTFLDSIPGIYLGAPDESHALTVLPGHKMLLSGKGNLAVGLTIIGSFFSLLLCTMLVPFLIKITEIVYPIIKDYIGYILLGVIAYLIYQGKNRLESTLIFLLSGTLGLIVLNLKNIENPLFPLLSGLFGFSVLLISLKDNNKIPKQGHSENIDVENKDIIHAVSRATVFGFIASFLPGFGSSQAAILASKTMKQASTESFMILVGGINTVNMTLSLGTLYLLEKARNGAVLAVSVIIGDFTMGHLLLYLSTGIIAGSIAVTLAMIISKFFANMISKIDYRMLISGILVVITIMTIILSGFTGFLILVTATGLGIMAGLLNVGKNNCLGCLIIPVILFFLI
ncbi:MAG: tripartite tricarboxylate transporter permease [Candidatus Woesearchaeota archaeon]